ncbi:hypothetical protein EVAR_29864_1 [Eumeta japonica]|uniref:Uncharacterized protein n=1 Tax=Eumeta variegata TaxID=151549 RepID=A0A4C1V738_EUMVA|nr:hypothetical protein EVAR_29864_1 [Eumeta japonica]
MSNERDFSGLSSPNFSCPLAAKTNICHRILTLTAYIRLASELHRGFVGSPVKLAGKTRRWMIASSWFQKPSRQAHQNIIGKTVNRSLNRQPNRRSCNSMTLIYVTL